MSNLDLEQSENDVQIPCEFCNEMIFFNEYEEHIASCFIRSNTIDQSTFVIYRDVETNSIFRINITPLLGAINNLGINDGGANDNEYAFNSLISEYLGNVDVGIENINDVVQGCNDDADDICPVCRDTISPESHVKTLCKHSFCRGCITTWLSSHISCPICAIDLRNLIQKSEDI